VLLPVGRDGLVDPAAVVAARADLVSVALVNAETGVRQNVAVLAQAAAATGARLHVDAAQALATVAVDVRCWPIDALTLSSHKLGGPAGVGALWVRRGTPIAPLLHGGPQEAGRRAGTEPVAAIAGFAAALTAASEERAGEAARLAALGARLRAGIAALDPTARLTAAGDGAPHLVHAIFPDRIAESLVAALDLEGVAVSAGSACAAGAAEPSHVLLAMGYGRADAAAGLRISLGWASTAADVDAILAALGRVLARARGTETAWPALAS
jgi:cysteine desulfurase